MLNYYPNIKVLLLAIEILTALVALAYLFKLKNSYWKWFSVYLIFIGVQELFWYFNTSLISLKQEYYVYFGIPIQYLFLFWLYASKSLKNKKLFLICLIIYLLTYLPLEIYLKKINVVYSINLTVGTLLLTLLIILEFKKQILNDDILKFRENKMFYINIGLILFYIGTYPFIAFYDTLSHKPYIAIWNIYFLYFLIANIIMYLLFIASFIWGKHHS